jgi:hypothetical protein
MNYGAGGAVMSDPQTLAGEIKDAWRGSTESVLRACAKAAEARSDGCLNDVAGELRGVVDPSTLRRLAIIGECAHIQAANPASLPPSWGTLYELTKLAEGAFRARYAAGEITPGLQRGTVAGWLKDAKDARVAVQTAIAAALAPFPNPAPAKAQGALTVEGALDILDTLRQSGKPAEYVGKVKPARIQLAIAFLQAILAAETGTNLVKA